MNFRMELTIPEQIAASVSGAGITALTMTPFDVVKGKNPLKLNKLKIVIKFAHRFAQKRSNSCPIVMA